MPAAKPAVVRKTISNIRPHGSVALGQAHRGALELEEGVSHSRTTTPNVTTRHSFGNGFSVVDRCIMEFRGENPTKTYTFGYSFFVCDTIEFVRFSVWL